MLFNSIEFIIFFILVTSLYFILPHILRWRLLLAASCVFYMFFKPEYILILFFTIVVDYYAGILIEAAKTAKRRKGFLIMSIIANVGVLAVFKYYNFINDNITGFASLFGATNHIPYLTMLLPIGLSFHTFQAMSYTMEVYRGNFRAEKHFGIYALYVMFYPQLVAGPIERPQHMLHQFHERKYFSRENLVSGLKLMLYGFFKKIVIADRLAMYVDTVYNDPTRHFGWQVITASIFFAFQIYCDFSGYSDIAIGSAKIMGFQLMQNFNYPYNAKSVTEFWRRWHISLSTWFRDYLYFPLGGSREGRFITYRNVLIVFLVSGLWHGAGWTFIIWGLLHALFQITELIRNQYWPTLRLRNAFLSRFIVFVLVTVAWVFFRANNLQDAFTILGNSTKNLESTGNVFSREFYYFLVVLLFLFIEYLWRKKEDVVNRLTQSSLVMRAMRFSYYSLLFWCIVVWGVFDKKSFIYFQF